MERGWFNEELSKAFQDWKSGMAKEGDMKNLESAIVFAFRNGIDLELKMPTKAIEGTVGSRPISREAAARFSTKTEGNFYFFEIASKLSMKLYEGSQRLSLKAEMYPERAVILLESPEHGVIGLFYPDEIASLQQK